MNQRPVASKLVNFRMPETILEPFDHICLLSGKTRTQVLSELIQEHVSNVGSKITSEISQTKRFNKMLKKLAMNKCRQ